MHRLIGMHRPVRAGVRCGTNGPPLSDMPSQPHVLILTHSADHYVIDLVAEALRRRGARSHRLDTDLFPLEIRLSARMGSRGTSHRIGTGKDAIEAGEISAVWARKIWTPRMAENLDPRMREGCVRESTAAMYGFLDGYSSARWVNALAASNEAENKLRQLRIAQEIGLRIPRTLVTNDPDEAREFHAETAPIVAKMLTPLSTSMVGTSFFVHTSPVGEQDLEHLEGLRHSPMVFQENIPKDVELRVICVGERHFVGAIDASRSQSGQTDWRAAKPDEVRWTRADLPGDVAQPLHLLLERLGLIYGAVDLIRRPDGEHVFLEVNPGGEWGMLERDLGLPISEALADALLEQPENAT
jgi:MvdC family ATP-grasp ribosomal peptide maturase